MNSKVSAIHQENVFREKMATMKSRNEVEVSNLRKIISDRDLTIAHQVKENEKYRNRLNETVQKKESEITLLKSTIEELKIEFHNSKFNQEKLHLIFNSTIKSTMQ